MMSLVSQVMQFVRDEEGSELVEWALVAGLIIVVGATAFIAIGGNVDTIFQALNSTVSEAANEASSG